MDTQTKRRILSSVFIGCGFACSWISSLFENAGKISFAIAVVGVTALIAAVIYEIVLYRRNLKAPQD